jgi:hypothetical protein
VACKTEYVANKLGVTRRKSRTYFVEPFLKFREVRSSPVDLATASATPEPLVINLRERLELLNHIGFGDFLQWRIATETPRKRSNRIQKVKATDYLDGLFIGILRTRAIAGFHNRMHEQPPVARQECAIFAFHYAEQLPILRLVIISDIEAEQAQIAREFPKVSIRDKTFNTTGL